MHDGIDIAIEHAVRHDKITARATAEQTFTAIKLFIEHPEVAAHKFKVRVIHIMRITLNTTKCTTSTCFIVVGRNTKITIEKLDFDSKMSRTGCTPTMRAIGKISFAHEITIVELIGDIIKTITIFGQIRQCLVTRPTNLASELADIIRVIVDFHNERIASRTAGRNAVSNLPIAFSIPADGLQEVFPRSELVGGRTIGIVRIFRTWGTRFIRGRPREGRGECGLREGESDRGESETFESFYQLHFCSCPCC